MQQIDLYKMRGVKWILFKLFSIVLKFLQRISIHRVDKEANSVRCGKLLGYLKISSLLLLYVPLVSCLLYNMA